jgi:hypothetical protein
MTKNVNVQYVGFEAKALVREYSFIVRRALNEAFGSRRVRFQDAPEICLLRLQRELAVFGNQPPQAHYRISETRPGRLPKLSRTKGLGLPLQAKGSTGPLV